MKKSIFFYFVFFLSGVTRGQVTVSQYTFSIAAGTYTDISGTGTYIGTGDDVAWFSFPIGFTFAYHCENFTTFGITTNGFIRLGAKPPAGSNGVNYECAAGSTATDSNTIGGMSADLYQMYSGAGKIWYQTTGVPGSRVCTIEWQHMYFWGAAGDYSDDANFQIQLFEGTNAINFVYGHAWESGHYNRYAQIGLRGVANTDYNLVNDAGGTLQWNAVTATSVGGNTLRKLWGISNSNEPALGLTYIWTPPVGACPSSPLPITLTSFTANYIGQNNSVLAAWTVEVQVNNKEFIVEKTMDGINYRKVATVPGAGTYPFTKSYSAYDYNPTIGVSYYRLKQVDMDGDSTVFSPVPIFIGNDPGNSLNMYPNPVGVNATLIYNSTNGNPLTIEIIDVIGRVVTSLTLDNVQKGENTFSINTSGLPSGMYILRAIGTERVYILKFIKQS